MSKSSTSLFPGIVLILIGTLLLVHKWGIFAFSWPRTYPLLLMVLGLGLFVSFIVGKNTSAIFWGTITLLTGVFFFLRNYYFIDYYFMHDIWPIFLIIIAIAFFVLFAVRPQDWGVLIPGSVLLILGISFLLRNLHFWRAQEIIRQYWPVVLIIIGGGIILSNFKKQK